MAYEVAEGTSAGIADSCTVRLRSPKGDGHFLHDHRVKVMRHDANVHDRVAEFLEELGGKRLRQDVREVPLGRDVRHADDSALAPPR